ncbi:MAG: hypothetical protein M3Q46_08895 [Verrucomicrobiota bacterium]|nr:hypothetical protein [Verrucomicrobiota bacterium]
MKKIFLSILLAGATSVAFGQGQGELTTTTTTNTATGEVTTTLPKPRPPAAAPIVPTEGVVQVAIRTGNPIQLINPAAPARYGNAQEHVSHDPKNPGKPKGIVLFAWSF